MNAQSSSSSATPAARADLGYTVLALLLTAGVVGLLFATRALDMTGDSLNYARMAAEGEDLFHPHHLVFTAAVRLAYLALGRLTGHWDVLLAAQIHNLAFLALGLLAMFWIGWRRLGSAAIGLVGMVAWVSTSGLMMYATQVEVYVPAIACLAVATAVLLNQRPSRAHLTLIASWWTLGVLYHQTSVLWAVPLFVYLLRKGRTLQAVGVSALAGLTTIGAYAAAFFAKGQKGLGFIEFCLYYAQHGSEDWGTTSNLGWDGLTKLGNTQWRALSALPGAPAIFIGLALLIAVLLFLAVRSRSLRAPEQALCFFAALWYLSYGLFFWWWLPSEVEFCVLMTVPLILAVLSAIAQVKQQTTWSRPTLRTGLLAGIMLASLLGFHYNFRTVVLPQHRDLGTNYKSAERLFEASGDECLVLARHKTFTTFRFYFSKHRYRSFEITRAFQRVTTQQAHRVPRHRTACLVLESRELLPHRSFQGLNGNRAPKRWLHFLRWLFGATPCEGDGSAICTQKVRWGPTSKNSSILRIGGGTERFESLDAFLGHFAKSAAEPHPRLSRDLHRWIATHREAIEEQTGVGSPAASFANPGQR